MGLGAEGGMAGHMPAIPEHGAASLRHPERQAYLLRNAREAHERGALIDAERGYLELLALDPSHAEACNLLGALRFQQDRFADAEVLIRRSIMWMPSALAHANLAGVLLSLGHRAEALEELDKALMLNPVHRRSLMQRAGLLLELGRFAEAVQAYDQLLTVVPTFADGFARRAHALRAQEQLSEALASCDRALALNTRSVEALQERGNVLRELGRHDDAVASYGRALAVMPGDPDLLFMRGMTLLDLGRLELALASFNEAVAGSPDFTDAIYNSAVVLERLGRFEEALERCDRALALDAAHAKAHANRGNVLQTIGHNTHAAASYEKALEIEPDALEVWCNYASTLRHLNRRDEALQACERALTLASDYLPAWYARGRVLQGLHRYDEALANFEHVIAYSAQDRFAYFHRGNVLTTLRRHEEAKDAFSQAIAIEPDYVAAHCNRAFLCLSIGDFHHGWEEYEWRWRDSQMSGGVRTFAQPRWTGIEPLAGKTILLYAEQGLGDTLQFCRYVPLVKALGATVIFEAQPELQSLLVNLAGVDKFIDRSRLGPLPPFDVYCPLLSLPLALRTELSTIPREVPYLQADSAAIEKWRLKLGAHDRPRVGLVWSGNPQHLNDRNRSIPLASLLPLMSETFEWVSLQKVVREEDEAALASSRLRHFGGDLVDFSDTAALLQTLDCVVSVDTSVAHLAGALGRPLLMMLPHTPDFRWMLDRADSPWYPQAWLFRQSQPGEWNDVFEQIVAALPSVVSDASTAAFA
jgi:tetratricopeptide (TPR) repeat protein